MILNQIYINGKIYTVFELNELFNEIENGRFALYDNIAIHYSGFALPVYTNRPIGVDPGAYMLGNGMIQYVLPITENDYALYNECNIAYFGNSKDLQELINAQEQLCRSEYSHLVSSNDEAFIPNMDPTEDTALMYAVKASVAAKKCNINNYAERFGNDFNNDKRKFSSNTITAGKAENILKNLDIRATLVVQDLTPDVANPIGKTLVFPWIGDGKNDNAYVEHIRTALNSIPQIKL